MHKMKRRPEKREPNIFSKGTWEPFKQLEQKRKKKGVREGSDHTPRPQLATESLSHLGYSHRPTDRWGKLLHSLDSYLGHPSETESSRLIPPSGGPGINCAAIHRSTIRGDVVEDYDAIFDCHVVRLGLRGLGTRSVRCAGLASAFLRGGRFS